jgi:hypothetical protein
MKIALIDGDLLGLGNHRFPNLALMKISSFRKVMGDNVTLILDYKELTGGLFVKKYDKIFISKAFTWSYVPEEITSMSNVVTGGTGFFYDKAIPLSYEIEHSMPDYSLYDEFVRVKELARNKKTSLKHYKEYSVGYSTRGCFRGCGFCVLKNERKVNLHSSLFEFTDPTRKKIAMLDDNILGCAKYPQIFEQIKDTGKAFKYTQAMDIRLMTDKKTKIILPLRYDGDYFFAFDLWDHKEKVEKGLKLWSESYYKIKNSKAKSIHTQLYCICAYDDDNKYDLNFFINDIIILFNRIEIIFKYKANPYVMCFEKWKESPFPYLYTALRQWSLRPANCKKYSFNEYIEVSGKTKAMLLRDKYPEFRKLWDVKL